MRWSVVALSLVFCGVLAVSTTSAAEALAEKYLQSGRLSEGASALDAHLLKAPADDEARFGLGFVRTLQAFEHLGASLYKYGLRTERGFLRPNEELRAVWRQNPDPATLSYKDVRKILQTLVDDLTAAEAVLAKIKNPKVKFPLHMALIKFDVMGIGEPVTAAGVLGRRDPSLTQEQLEQFVIAFDRGDVAWLRGYLHLLSAWGEVALAIDGQEIFDCTAHLFFEKVVTPHPFLLEDRTTFDGIFRIERPAISDVIAFIHTMKFSIKEPARMKSALAHLESTAALAHEMWEFILAETDDDHEWIPNPKQTGVVGVQVTESIVTDWKSTLDEVDLILQGKRLIPFWRGTNAKRGLNLRRVFTEPTSLDPVLWFQGTAATPYLETGTITDLADPESLGRLSRNFGGSNFFGFMLWFN